jgi:aminopeptidase-like protein
MNKNKLFEGKKMHDLAKELWPISRSLTGEGNRKTLKILKKVCKNLKIFEINSDTKVFDWKIPNEWVARKAWIKDSKGKKILDFTKNNLHLMGYSIPVHKKINFKELKKKIHTLKNKPNAIPYVTSYYNKDWGFSLSFNDFKKLDKKETYEVLIDTELKKGSLTFGEILIPGKTKKEILISTNICHPSMANNELSGPVVSTYLAKWINKKKNRKYSYRILFLPETIGAIAYLSKKYKYLKKNVVAGYNVVCVGDNKKYSYLPSRNGDTFSDIIAQYVLKTKIKKFKQYSWLDRGSDERQYCSPGIDLPIASIMRSKYGTFPEYHTSEDNLLKVVTPAGLQGGYDILKDALELIEKNFFLKSLVLCEPFYNKRGMYPKFTVKGDNFRELMLKMNHIVSYSDNKTPAIAIAEKLSITFDKFLSLVKILERKKIVKKIDY